MTDVLAAGSSYHRTWKGPLEPGRPACGQTLWSQQMAPQHALWLSSAVPRPAGWSFNNGPLGSLTGPLATTPRLSRGCPPGDGGWRMPLQPSALLQSWPACLGGLCLEGPFFSLPISFLPTCPGHLPALSTGCASCPSLCPRLVCPLALQAQGLLPPCSCAPGVAATQRGALWRTEMGSGWSPTDQCSWES